MSKILKQYNELKRKNASSIYLIRNGIFYIAINEDAKLLNEKIGLKITYLSPEITKCGFPISSLDKYIKKLDDLQLKYEVVNNLPENTNITEYTNNIEIQKILKQLIDLDLNKTTPLQSLNILLEIQNKLKKLGE